MPFASPRRLLGLVWAAVLAAFLPGQAGAAGIVPHDAFYGIDLVSAQGGTAIDTVSGDMAIRWEGDCAGWTMNHRTVFRIGYSNGDSTRLTIDASTWEARSGDSYSFLVRTLVNGKETERVEGRAVAGPKTEAVFVAPEPKVLDLPEDAVFPTRHTEMVLDAAARDDRFLSVRLFDGFTEEGAILVNAAIGRQRAAPDGPKSSFPELRGRAAWPVQLAFFGAGAAATPESEIGMLLYDNGVTDLIDLDFGDFKVRAQMEQLKTFPVPDCG